MSNSLKNIPKINKILSKHNIFTEKPQKREVSSNKSKAYLNLNNSNNKYINKNINKDLSILSIITNSTDIKNSVRTFWSDTEQEKQDYELYMINKYDENLDNSLSFISEFDLEGEEKI